MSIMVATGRGATMGILFRNAEAIEVMRKVDTLVVDKTGTLTEGKPRLVTVNALEGDEVRLLSMAAGLEAASEHPLAGAVIAGARDRGIPVARATDFESITGRGISGRVGDHAVLVGNKGLLEEHGVSVGSLDAAADSLRALGQTVLFVAIDRRLAGLLGVADPVKESAHEAVRALHATRLRVIMLTGDTRRTAGAVARQLGIDAVEADVLPAGKRDVIRRLQQDGHVVAMAGDGINDAPALAEAAVGIAMGTGADIAIESAGITLVRGDLRGIVQARRLSAATMRNIRQNLFLAFVYNTLGVPVAAGLLYPVLGVLVSPIWASAAMTLSSVSVILNSLRLRRVTLSGRSREEERSAMERDVVCGMEVDPAKAAGSSEYQGKRYYFCSASCKARFDANLKQYAR
jgi:Cu+-exporting ATPase